MASACDAAGFRHVGVNGVKQVSHAVADNGVTACQALRRKPERPANGKSPLRIPPGLHAHTIRIAWLRGQNLTPQAAEALCDAI